MILGFFPSEKTTVPEIGEKMANINTDGFSESEARIYLKQIGAHSHELYRYFYRRGRWLYIKDLYESNNPRTLWLAYL